MEKMTKEAKMKRNETVISEYEAGKSIEAIAEEMNISRKTVLGILIYNKVYKAKPKVTKPKRPSKAEILQKAEVPEEILTIDKVGNLPTDSILELADLVDGKDRSDFKGIIKRKTA